MADNDIIDFPLEIDHNIPDNAIRETETRTKLVQNFDEVIHNPPPRAAKKLFPGTAPINQKKLIKRLLLKAHRKKVPS